MSTPEIAFVSTEFDNSGIGTYSREVYEELKRQGKQVTKIHLDYENQKIKIGDGETTRTIHKQRRLLTGDVLFHLRCRTDIPAGYDVYHLAHPGLSFLDVRPKIITCHDLVKYKFPRAFTEYLTRGLMYRPMTRADHVIAISQSTKADLKDILGMPDQNVTTVYNGVADRYRPIEAVDDTIFSTHDIPNDKRLILYVGSEEPRKNVSVLLEAFAGVHTDNENTHLVKIGSPSKFGSRAETHRQINTLGIEDAVTILEAVSERSLPHFYNAADIFVFPSLYEGFGLPVVEALACGTPVVVSDTSSLPEIVGDAGILCDPRSVSEFKAAISRLLSDERCIESKGKKGRKRAQQFTWENNVNKIIEVYRSVLRGLR